MFSSRHFEYKLNLNKWKRIGKNKMPAKAVEMLQVPLGCRGLEITAPLVKPTLAPSAAHAADVSHDGSLTLTLFITSVITSPLLLIIFVCLLVTESAFLLVFYWRFH